MVCVSDAPIPTAEHIPRKNEKKSESFIMKGIDKGGEETNE